MGPADTEGAEPGISAAADAEMPEDTNLEEGEEEDLNEDDVIPTVEEEEKEVMDVE